MKTLKANNSLYFKAFNEDFRAGGVLHKLDSSEFRTIVILQAYADGYGYVHKENGKPYSSNELSNMFGLNYRTTQKALLGLISKNLIELTEEGILLKFFSLDQSYREKNKQGSRARQAMAKDIKTIAARLNSDNVAIVEKSTGEIL